MEYCDRGFCREKRKGVLSLRVKFIKNTFQYLEDCDYVLLKYTERKLVKIGRFSDIDLILTSSCEDNILKFIKNSSDVKKYTLSNHSFMKIIYVVFNDESFLELDLINTFVRKHVVYLDKELLLRNYYINEEGVRLPEITFGFLYIFLFYILNKSDVDPKYRSYYLSLQLHEQEKIINFIKKRYDLPDNNIAELCRFDSQKLSLIKKYNSKDNLLHMRIKNLSMYIYNIFANIKKSKIITFSGVDGAGKTTILREFTTLLRSKYRRRVVELRHRPSVLPILSALKHGKEKAEKKTMDVLPRTGSNNSKISSYIRFFYYLIDYVLGQWVIFAKHGLKGDIVIYDRYYFDFIVDAKRTNINLNPKFIKFFYRFIFKPEMNIFLYANPDVILSRKQEMDKQSIVSLTLKYKALFSELDEFSNENYILIDNLDKSSTMRTIERNYYKEIL
jgi:thymidylate kinase